jgi:PAS domain S-box-containing protein
MSTENKDHLTKTQLLAENEDLRRQLDEAQETLEAIRKGDVDALVVAGPRGEQVFSITGAEHIYRVIVETMNEAGLTVDLNGTILFCNQRFCDLMKAPIHDVLGRKVATFAARPQQPSLRALLADGQIGAIQRRVTLRATDGTPVPVQISASPLQMDGTISICLVASDLTELEASANSIRVLREHQQALEESEARFRAIFESSQDAVVITNDEGVYVQANPAVQTIFGLPPEQLIGRRVSEFLGQATDFPTFWQSFLATGSFRGEMLITSADGQVRYVESYAVTNILPGWHLSVIRDITERKQAQEDLLTANEQLRIQTEELQTQTEELRAQTEELQVANEELSAREEELRVTNEALLESEGRYRELVQNANSVIIRWKKDGTITFFNEYAQAFFGYREEEAVGRHVNFLVPEQESTGADLTGLAHDMVKHPERYASYVNENVCRDGRRVWMAWTNRPIYNENAQVEEMLAVGTDITERKRAEDALRELTKTLESKVAQRTAELEYRARQLQKLTLELSETEDRERERLAEILHDDLQQILAAAKFHLNVLRNRAKYDPSTQAAAAQIDHMLKDAIDKSRALSHELSPAVLHHADFGETLGWLANQIQAKHGLLVRVDPFNKIELQSDALKAFLFKAAQELLFNVVKHARVKEARVRARRWGRCICLSVSDQGRGFDPQDLRATTGFGLFSIRERVELLGGRMKIKSAKGKGSTFHIVVPDGQLAEPGIAGGPLPADLAKETGRAPGEEGRRLRVLLADDHEIVREGLISLLSEEHNIQVVGEAANGREVVDLADRLRPDVIIMDVAMPLIDGDEATRQIKRHLPDTRVIALSMYEENGTRERMFEAGAEAYILKTAPSEELLAAIRSKAPDA